MYTALHPPTIAYPSIVLCCACFKVIFAKTTNITLSSSSFFDNGGANLGTVTGGLAHVGQSSRIVSARNKFRGNKANQGGVFYIEQADASFTRDEFSGNVGSGGCMFVTSAAIKINDSVLVGNLSPQLASVLEISDSSLELFR